MENIKKVMKMFIMKIKILLSDVKYKIFLLLFALSLFSNYYLILNFLNNISQETKINNIYHNQKILLNSLTHKYELIQKNNKIDNFNNEEAKVKLDLMKFLENNIELTHLKSNNDKKFLTFKNKFNINIEELLSINKKFEDLYKNINEIGKKQLDNLNNEILNYYNKLINDNLNINAENYYISKLLIASTLFITLLLLLILFDITRNTNFQKIQKEYYENLSKLFEKSNNSLLFSINEKRELIYFNDSFKEDFNYNEDYLNTKLEELKIFGVANMNKVNKELEILEKSENNSIRELNYLLLEDNNGYYSHYNVYITKTKNLNNKNNYIFNLVRTEEKDSKERKYEENNRIFKRLSLYDVSIKTLIDKLIFDERTERYNKDLIDKYIGLINIDIENFKNINQTFNYKFGDKLLKIFEEKIKNQFSNITLLNIGGTNYFIIKENSTKEELELFIKNFYSFIKKPYEIEGREIFLYFNIAATIYPEINKNIKDVLYEMNNLMYHSKHNNVKEMILINEDFKQKEMHIYELEQNLINSIKNDEIDVFFQPQYDSTKNRIIGAESLIRWKFGDNYISPHYFIPIAEKSDIIIKLSEIVIEKNFKAMLYLQENNLVGEDFTLSINISTKQLVNNDLSVLLKKLLEKYKVNAKNFVIEITESSLIGNKKYALELLTEIKELGFGLALDDFGTGYSSLNYLSNYPFDELKIDRSFIIDIEKDSQKVNILKGVISISKLLGMKLIAEGVENKEQLDILKNENCFNIQGYYFSLPLSFNDFKDKLFINKSLK